MGMPWSHLREYLRSGALQFTHAKPDKSGNLSVSECSLTVRLAPSCSWSQTFQNFHPKDVHTSGKQVVIPNPTQTWTIHCEDEADATMLTFFLKHVMPHAELYNKFLANNLIICRGTTNVRVIQLSDERARKSIQVDAKLDPTQNGNKITCYRVFTFAVCKKCGPHKGPLKLKRDEPEHLQGDVTANGKCFDCGSNYDDTYEFSQQEWSIKKEIGKKTACTGG